MITAKVNVVLVNYKAVSKTLDCVQALCKGTILPECIYIVDNACSAESRKDFEQIASSGTSTPIKLIFNEQNLGFAAACNQGIAASFAKSLAKDERNTCEDSDFVWLLNNDTIPSETALEKLLEKAKETDAAITGSKILDAKGNYSGGVGKIHPFFASVHRANQDEAEFDYVEGSSMLISRECVQKIGLMSEDYFLYFEESDYCSKAKDAGLSLAWATDSIINHDIGTSTGSEIGKGSVPYFIDCIMIRNRIHFASRNRIPKIGIAAGFIISLLLRVKRLQWKRVLKILQITLCRHSFKKFVLNNGGYIK
ncbi:MAG: glycosyltransferase family 2 protein [Fibrobacter sp.]|nr:glycosyltransferase family 2 protein [Fibrobacter sp.]